MALSVLKSPANLKILSQKVKKTKKAEEADLLRQILIDKTHRQSTQYFIIFNSQRKFIRIKSEIDKRL